MDNSESELLKGYKTAFLSEDCVSSLEYRPEFITNDFRKGKKVLSSIENELKRCEAFFISVAFITMSGVEPLLGILKELERKGIKGKILTTDYLQFSEPRALEKLNSLSNIELRMYVTNPDDDKNEGFHTKGYIFQHDDVYRIIIGSSNLTSNALTLNREWNTKIVAREDGELTQAVLTEFSELWNSERSLSFDSFIDDYKFCYEQARANRNVKPGAIVRGKKFEPNSMQVGFVKNLKEIIEKNGKRALLISSCGSGKTYASAFAMKELQPQKILFVVHRETIAKQAMRTYKNVLGTDKKYGLLSGSSKDYDADVLFSTMQMMAKTDVLSRFSPEDFDVIVVDEVHRAGADSYRRIMNYFKPNFWLGMTASPERTDGFDIFELFDHNIAYEIRLQKALEENLLCPFHYFGVTDLEIEGIPVDDETGLRNFSYLVSDARVNHILEQIKYYGYSGDRVKGLIFVSSRQEGEELSNIFNARGYRTEFLSGIDSQEKREDAIRRLEQEEDNGWALDYIFTVDIFNEGVDIPSVNQVIMLRPTESPIVFVQQLGRGLRKHSNKEYVVILDFIGNYTNNFMIPIALSGDRTYNKDTNRRFVLDGSQVIPGASTIYFDEISKKRIFESIDRSSTKLNFLRERYVALKNKLGRIPTLLDFYTFGDVDPQLFIDYTRTYDQFLLRVDPEYKIRFSELAEAYIDFVSAFLINGKRLHELVVLKELMGRGEIDLDSIAAEMKRYDLVSMRDEDYISAIRMLNMDFINSESERKRYEKVEFIRLESTGEKVRMSERFAKLLENDEFRNEIKMLVDLGIERWQNEYINHDEDNLVLYQKYSRKDVCRILNWEKDDSSTVYGYRIKYNTCPIFVTYEKKDDISESTKYADHFVNNRQFNWMTRNKVTESSPEALQLNNAAVSGLKTYLFVKKSDGEGMDFYYMGKVMPTDGVQTEIAGKDGKMLPIMNYQLRLERGVRGDIYDYFTE